MPSLSSVALLLSDSPELLFLAKATLVIAVGLGAARLARTARASVRHLVIASSFVALAEAVIVRRDYQ